MFNSLLFFTKSFLFLWLSQTFLWAESINTIDENLVSVIFSQEEQLKSGDIVGINKKTGKIRPYRIGDYLIGVAPPQSNKKNALVGIIGALSFNRDQVEISRAQVFTKDGQLIGQLVSSGKVYVNISSNVNVKPLLKKIKILRSMLKAEQLQNKLQTKQIIDLQNKVRELADQL